MGLKIAETMTEIFRGLPPGHPLFEQFSFIGADELGEFEAILRRRTTRQGLSRTDGAVCSPCRSPMWSRGTASASSTILSRKQLVRTRAAVHHMFERQEDPGVDFYDVERGLRRGTSEGQPSVRPRQLPGRQRPARVTEAISAVVAELGLREAVERIGLDHQVGPAGRLLSAQQRASVSLVRSLVKRPDILVVDGALAPFDEGRAKDASAPPGAQQGAASSSSCPTTGRPMPSMS